MTQELKRTSAEKDDHQQKLPGSHVFIKFIGWGGIYNGLEKLYLLYFTLDH